MLGRSTLLVAASFDITSARSFATAARVASRRPQTKSKSAPAAAGKAKGTPAAAPDAPARAPRLEDGSPKYPLKPNVLSTRLKELSSMGKHEEAVATLKSMPLGAQNAPVWNTLIWECMKARKYALGYKLYVDMKRRGVFPTTRTYATMFSGLARIPRESWPSFTKQQDHAMHLWSNFSNHLAELKARPGGPPSTDFEHISLATASYFTILAHSGRHQKVFDILYGLDNHGPLAPDNVVFTALFRAIGERKSLTSHPSPVSDLFDDPGSVLSIESTAEEGAGARGKEAHAVAYQNASDARLVWRQMMTIFTANSERGLGARYTLDSHTFSAAINVFALGKPSDQSFALDFVQKHLGLSPTRAKNTDAAAGPLPTAPKLKSGTLGPKATLPPLLTTHTLQAALRLAEATGRPQVVISLFQQVLDLEHSARVSPADSIIDRGHVEHVLRAHRKLGAQTLAADTLELLRWAVQREHLGAGAGVRPQAPTYRAALLACWRAGDWRAACAVWELMSGWQAAAFKDGITNQKQRVLRGKNLNIDPGVEEMSAFAVAASVAARAGIADGSRRRDATVLRQCLRMLVAAGVARALRGERMHPQDSVKDITRARLAQAVVDLVEDALPKAPKPVANADGETGIPAEQAREEAQWRELADFARTVVSNYEAHKPGSSKPGSSKPGSSKPRRSPPSAKPQKPTV